MRFCLVCLVLMSLPVWLAPHHDLRDTVLVLDPGHGDAGSTSLAADPGAAVEGAWECVYTWDTAMRLKRRAEHLGARVVLTLQASDDELRPHDTDIIRDFRMKPLVECPQPADEWQALQARVATANRVYRECASAADVYFISLHFDSTSPRLCGVSFYYPPWCARQPFTTALEDDIRAAGLARQDVTSGRELKLDMPYHYSVLSGSDNPDACLIELGNMRNEHDRRRMLSAAAREEYAAVVLRALLRQAVRPVHPRRDRRWRLLLLGLVVAAWLYRRGRVK